jgi:hypothetical protein
MSVPRLPVFLAGATAIPTSLAVAAVVAQLLRPISVDVPIEPGGLNGWGMRWGVLLAVFLATAATLGDRRLASPAQVIRMLALSVALLLGMAAVAVLLSVVAARLGLVGQSWGVSSRSGYAARVATVTSLELLGLPVALWASVDLFRRRGIRPPPLPRTPHPDAAGPG